MLKPYRLGALEQLNREGMLVAVRDADVEAALHVEPRGAAGLEVVALATDPEAQRRGYGLALLSELFAKHPNTTIGLKVEATNSAACRLYERVGFVRNERKTERWWYLTLEPLS